MNDLEKAKQIKIEFRKIYEPLLKEKDNNLSLGLNRDKNGQFTIEARLQNTNGRKILPKIFDGLEIKVLIIGDIIPYTDKE